MLKAIAAGLRKALEFVWKLTSTGLQLVAAPINWLGNLLHGGGYDLPEPDEAEASAPSRYAADFVMNHPEVQQALGQDPLALVFAYLRTAPEERSKINLSGLDVGTRAWVKTLPEEEEKLLLKAGMRATVNHVRGIFQVPGVRFPLAVQQQLDQQKAVEAAATAPKQPAKPRMGYTKESPYVLVELPPKPRIDPQFRQFRSNAPGDPSYQS